MARKPLTKRVVSESNKLRCNLCGIEKPEQKFYKIFNSESVTKFFVCKECIKNICVKDNIVNQEEFKKILRQMDKPFLSNLFADIEAKEQDPVGKYFACLCLPAFNTMTWDDSIIYEIKPDRKQEENIVTDEIRELFGAGYSEEEYSAMQRKYNFLKNNYKEKTNMHIEALINYVRYKVKDEFATANGRVDDAKKWAAMAKDAATAAKINPSQFSVSDLQDGLSTFGQVVRAVEQSIDIIPILPHFKERPQDKVDFTLLCYINYIRDLKGLPHCEYKEIYKFYNDRVKEYKDRFDFLNDASDNAESEDGG